MPPHISPHLSTQSTARLAQAGARGDGANAMAYCKKLKRPCACGRLVTYDRQGRLSEGQGGPDCLTDTEVRSMLTVLLQEWRRRCQAMEGMEASASYH